MLPFFSFAAGYILTNSTNGFILPANFFNERSPKRLKISWIQPPLRVRTRLGRQFGDTVHSICTDQIQLSSITAASGIAAELGIPLTHRGVSNSVRFLTGHSRKGGNDPLFVAENASDPDSTLVVYMGLSTLPSLALKLMHHGLPPNTPAAVVEQENTPQQRTVFVELGDLADKITSAELTSPTLIIIGKVIALSPFWPQPFKEASLVLEAR